MGTRFVATQESDFEKMWKEKIVKSCERDTLYCRGFAGPLRHLRNKKALELGELTLQKSPRLFLGEADASLDPEVYEFEFSGWKKIAEGDEEGALLFGGEVAGRINDIPKVAELVTRISQEAEEVLKSLPRFIGSGI